MTQLLGALRGRATTCNTARGRRPFRAYAAAKAGGDAGNVQSARLSRILRQYEAAGVESQKAELEAYQAARAGQLAGDRDAPGYARGLRASVGSRATSQQLDAKMDLYLPMGPNGIRSHNVGLHGQGQDVWWAIRVKPNREKQVSEALERAVADLLPPLAPLEEGGPSRPRTIEMWVPKKTLKVWNPKTEKMGNKVLRYPARYPDVLDSGENGGWVLARAMLDMDLYNRIKSNPSVL